MKKELAAFGLGVAAVVALIVLVPKYRWVTLTGLCSGIATVVLITWHAARYRLPKEPWWHWFERVMKPRDKGWAYYNCKLECGHYALVRSSRPPRRTETAWCPAHHWNRSEQTSVELASAYPPSGQGKRIVAGAVLDDDLLDTW